jgi:hypothetical protein
VFGASGLAGLVRVAGSSANGLGVGDSWGCTLGGDSAVRSVRGEGLLRQPMAVAANAEHASR